MERRRFLGAVAVGAAAVGGHSAKAAPLLTLAVGADRFEVGQRYRSACGRDLQLTAIDEERSTPRNRSYRLRFSGTVCKSLVEGTHVLQGPAGEVALFLQPAGDAAVVAWFNHLA